jgi:hypothetical protein
MPLFMYRCPTTGLRSLARLDLGKFSDNLEPVRLRDHTGLASVNRYFVPFRIDCEAAFISGEASLRLSDEWPSRASSRVLLLIAS